SGRSGWPTTGAAAACWRRPSRARSGPCGWPTNGPVSPRRRSRLSSAMRPGPRSGTRSRPAAPPVCSPAAAICRSARGGRTLGHWVPAAGGGGLLRVLGALGDGVRPATLGADDPIDALDGTPLRLLAAPEEWPGPRRAGVSAFGFGGANAHLIVEAFQSGARV